MNAAQAERVLRRGCDGKLAYCAPTAHEVADRHGLSAYRCLVDPTHWHVGHMPSVEGLATIAEAIRVRAGCAPGERAS